MNAREALIKRARSDLIFVIDAHRTELSLWEHSHRVAESALRIAKLLEPAIGPANATALLAGGLYHDSGWSIEYQNGIVDRDDLLSRPTSEIQRELGAAWAQERLADILDPPTLAVATEAIRQMQLHRADSCEAHILWEAESLEAVGLIAFWHATRRHMHDGKGLEVAIETWRRQCEYRFWEAKIESSFRYARTRDLAYRRLATLKRFMQSLSAESEGSDIDLVAAPAAAECSLHQIEELR